MKNFTVIFIAIICFLTSHGEAAGEAHLPIDVKKNLIEITQKLQAYEVNLSQYEKELGLLKGQEQEVFASIAKQQHILASALQSIKHWRDYSPVLIALSSVSLDDLVHSFLILQSCAPKLEKQNRAILAAVKKVVELRAQIQKQGTDYANLKAFYHEALKTQAHLFESKFQEHPVLDTSEIKRLREKVNDLKSAPLEEVLKQLQSFFSKSEDAKDSDLRLIHVAVGDLQQSCQGEPCPNNILRISTRSEAQIVSPCDATVVYIGSHLEKSQLVILMRRSYFIVLSGLGSVNCRVGENVTEGEPIGCALSWTTNWSTNKPQSNFKNEDKVVSLQLRKGTQFVDSKPYLRSIPNDKKV
ncbi:MAG: hypothetical protein K2W94_09140 [Alphaproteobacteria bacterium]|nr:hypothetical protein [Alphaproteobacteria bacterium]